MHIRSMCHRDADAVRDIYAQGIATGNATFASRPPNWDTFDRTHLDNPRLVAVEDGQVLGWVAAAPTSARQVYAGVVENSIYIASHARGRGAGAKLLSQFITAAEEAGIWTIVAGIFPDNTASITLHHAHGFETVGISRQIGQTAGGVWRDVLRLEHRSRVVGVDAPARSRRG